MTTYRVGPNWVHTTLGDGAEVHAVAQHDVVSSFRASSLGYPDVESMTREHDPLHVMLADMLQLHESPALRRAAQGLSEPTALTEAEECAVLAIARFWNLARGAA